MQKNKPNFTVYDLSDDQIETCFDGASNVEMVRNLLIEAYNKDLNSVDEMDFSFEFADAIKGFIDAEEGTDEWEEAYDNNCEWGGSIAQNVNELIEALNK
jgi:hypothetical protein